MTSFLDDRNMNLFRFLLFSILIVFFVNINSVWALDFSENNNLAQLIKCKQINKPVRLLSCNTDAAAIELSTALGSDISFYASHGFVDITTDGIVTSQNKFFKYNNGAKFDDDFLSLNPTNAPPPTANSNRVRLGLVEAGSGWVGKLDNQLAKPHFIQFQSKLTNFSSWGANSPPSRLANYGTPTALKNRIKTLIESPSVTNIRSSDEIIDYLDDFMLKYANEFPEIGALAYFDELLQTASKFKGGAYGLEVLNNLPQTSLNGKTLIKFEASIDDLANTSKGCRFDLQFSDGTKIIFVETKNYAKTTSFTTQFKAYISNPNLTSLDQIKYFFRANTGITKAERVQKFKNMLLNNDKYKDIYNANSALFNSIQISNKN